MRWNCIDYHDKRVEYHYVAIHLFRETVVDGKTLMEQDFSAKLVASLRVARTRGWLESSMLVVATVGK